MDWICREDICLRYWSVRANGVQASGTLPQPASPRDRLILHCWRRAKRHQRTLFAPCANRRLAICGFNDGSAVEIWGTGKVKVGEAGKEDAPCSERERKSCPCVGRGGVRHIGCGLACATSMLAPGTTLDPSVAVPDADGAVDAWHWLLWLRDWASEANWVNTDSICCIN